MGKVRFGIPEDLALKLRNAFGIKQFVETGTYKGGTAVWASQHFERVTTIEAYRQYFEKASFTHHDKRNIKFVYGDSREQLPKALKDINEPALIWLDAHWVGNTILSAGTDGECPIKEEIEALNDCRKRGLEHFILIDDAHCFLGSLPSESDRSLWPDLDDIKNWLSGYYVRVHEDVIIAVPPAARKIVDDHILRPGINVLVLTSNGYIHLLPGFAYLFNKHWSDKQLVTVLRYDKRPPQLPANFYTPAAGVQAEMSFTRGLRYWLESHYPADQLVLMLEDYYLDRDVDRERIRLLWEIMEARPEIDKIDLSGDLAIRGNPEFNPEMVKAQESDPFRGSLQAAIWRRDYLIDNLGHDMTPWQFEKHTCKGGLILGVKDPVIHYVNAVGGEGNFPGQLLRKRFPVDLWAELEAHRLT